MSTNSEVDQRFVMKGYGKLKSKRIKTIINDNLAKFEKEYVKTIEEHKGFYCVSRNLSKLLLKAGEESVVTALEFYQNVCNCSLVSQRYFEECRQKSAD